MTFDNSVKTCLRKSFTFEGRASRSEYWYFYLFVSLICVVGILLAFAIGADETSLGVVIVTCLLGILLLPAGISVEVRRFHDINRSGWNFWWGIIPYVGSLIILYFMVQPSKDSENEYGPMSE